MIITPGQLSTIHYYYFAMGTFGFCSMFFIGLDSLFSLIFLAFYVVNSAVGWYVAYVSRKRMKDYIIPQTMDFFLRHTVITLFCVGLAAGVWSSGFFTDAFLLNSIIMANYFVLFLAGLWYAFTRMDFFKDLFRFYDSYMLRKSKELIIRTRDAHKGFFGRELVKKKDIESYIYGTSHDVDENLISAWKNRRKFQYVLECMGRIELSLARSQIEQAKDNLYRLKVSTDPVEQRIARRNEQDIVGMERDVVRYEKEFYSKTGESDYL